jgi:hypothetical protein
VVSFASAFFAAVNIVYALVFGGPMDGTAWDVKVKREGFFHWSSRAETLVFTGGRLVIPGEVAKGLSPALYDAKDAGAATEFRAVLESPGQERSEWRGRAEGGRITGELVVLARDGAKLVYRFSGARRDG